MAGNPANPPPGKAAPPPVEATRLESAEEVRQALLARKAQLAGRAAAPPAKGQPGAQPVAQAVPVEVQPQPEKPYLRPPMALLCIVDDIGADGRQDGEWVRLRADRCVIGRSEGDVRIPHDVMMSGRHAELVRQKVANGFRWVLIDLQSTNGSFLRIGNTILRSGNEFIIGRGRYRFEVPTAPAAPTTGPDAGESTRAWGGSPVAALVPALVELTPADPAQRMPLTLAEYWIGRDATTCRIVRADDPLANARHARLFRDAQGSGTSRTTSRSTACGCAWTRCP